MISVIVSVYNVEDYIARCVESIQGQSYQDIEIILVDDGSTDNSGRMCEEYAKQDNRIRVVHKANGGNASARNAGIDVAKGDYLTFVDSDDFIDSKALENMITVALSENASIVSCGVITHRLDGEETIQCSETYRVMDRKETLEMLFSRQKDMNMSACTKLFSNSLFREEGLRFNNDVIHEDTESLPRWVDHSNKVVLLNKSFYHYIKRENSERESLKFNMRGYRFLDSLPEYERMCKDRYGDILMWFYFYQMDTLQGTLEYLNKCFDKDKYKREELSIRYRLFKVTVKCTKYRELRRTYAGKIKQDLLFSILGIDKTFKIVNG